MSAFGIGTNTEKADSGTLTGRQIKIACKAWFTSSGVIKPLSFKFEGDDADGKSCDGPVRGRKVLFRNPVHGIRLPGCDRRADPGV